jgi:hypothetical protein
MSAALLNDPSAPHEPCQDDRESAFYVLLWIALRFTRHTTFPKGLSSAGMTSPSLPNDDDVVLFLRAFDEAYADASGDVRGGGLKVAYLAGRLLAKGLQFTKRPELDSLVAKLKKVFKVRYEDEPDDEKFERMQQMKADNISENILIDNIAYDFLARSSKLRQRSWLVDTIRTHLNVGEWPNDDRAEAQRIVPNTGSKRKMMYEQTNLDERASKRPASGG